MIDIKQNIEYNYEYNNLELLQYYFEKKNGQEIFRRKYEYDENHRLKKESKIEQGLTEVITDYTYDEDKKVLKTETTSLGAMTYYLDDLNRLEHKDLLTANGKVITEKYSYLSSNGKTSQNIEKIIYKNNTEENETIYSYKINNITAINENGKNIASYDYDNIGRLKRENNAKFNKTYIYDYDAQGNITTKKEYAYDVNKLGSLQKTIIYGYELNSSIGSSDQIKSYNGCQLSQNYVYNPSTCQFDPEQVYDNIGNPRYWFKTENGETTRGYTLQWAKGRQLKSITDGNKIYEYEYNINGLRTKKIENGTTHEYLLDGERIIRTKSNGNNINRKIDYYYDTSGISGFKWNGKLYYYRKNLQGDITEIINDNGEIESSYIYDAWGKNKTCNPNGTENNDPMFIGNINPFRYRGYYYDSETRLYYLESRYYDPEVGRFINADDVSYLDPETLNGLNLYSYCGNNPVNRVDPAGHFWDWIFDIGFLIWSVVDVIKNPTDWKNWAALGVDLVFAVIPFVPSGAGQIIKVGNKIDNFVDVASALNKLDNFNDLRKVTMLGENMDRIKAAGKVIGISDNLYKPWKGYNATVDAGKLGKAKFVSHLHNLGWISGKLRMGYNILDTGIDVMRAVEKGRSTYYRMERISMFIWRTRNIWKLPINYFLYF